MLIRSLSNDKGMNFFLKKQEYIIILLGYRKRYPTIKGAFPHAIKSLSPLGYRKRYPTIKGQNSPLQHTLPSALTGIENDTHQKMRVHYLPRLVLFFLGYRKQYPSIKGDAKHPSTTPYPRSPGYRKRYPSIKGAFPHAIKPLSPLGYRKRYPS